MSLTEKAQRRAIADLSTMKFFPGDTDTRAAILNSFTKICSTDEQLDRTITKYTLCFAEWQGVHELRAVACSMFKPADGVEVNSQAVDKNDRLLYPEGIPAMAEFRNPALAAIPAAARRLNLPPAEQIEAARQARLTGRFLTETGQFNSGARIFTADPELEELVRSTAAACRAPEVPKPRTVAEIEEILYSRKTA